MKPKVISPVKAQRLKLQLNQLQFWSRVGVTQSGGSRFESGRDIPQPVAILLELAYGKNPVKYLADLRETTVELLVSGK